MLNLLLKFFPVGVVYTRNERGETPIDVAASQALRDLLKGLQRAAGEGIENLTFFRV